MDRCRERIARLVRVQRRRALSDATGSDGDYSGMREDEHASLACSCVEVLALAHRLERPRRRWTKVVTLANDVGLYSERIDPASKGFRGNSPQALTQLALINTAVVFEQSAASVSAARPESRSHADETRFGPRRPEHRG